MQYIVWYSVGTQLFKIFSKFKFEPISLNQGRILVLTYIYNL